MKRLNRLKKKLQDALDKQGVDVSEDLHHDLDRIVQDHSTRIASNFPEGSFERIFWDQQQQANGAKKAQGRRWHPLMIKWCLQSNVVYEVPCTCGKVYIGETKRLLETRLKEHKDACTRYLTDKSAIAEHAWANDHPINWAEVKILQ